MIPENETYSFEERIYQNPETSRDEQMDFINALRETQQVNNQEIRTQTENLGTDVPSQLGGLTGPESYFTQRYQTAPTNQTIAGLRSAAQASALNTALSNLQSQWNNKYQKAYRNYQKRASRGSSGSSYTPSATQSSSVVEPDVQETPTDMTAQPDEIMRRILQRKQEEENAKKAEEYIDELQGKTEQALTPQVNVLNQQEAIDYWKNLKR